MSGCETTASLLCRWFLVSVSFSHFTDYFSCESRTCEKFSRRIFQFYSWNQGYGWKTAYCGDSIDFSSPFRYESHGRWPIAHGLLSRSLQCLHCLHPLFFEIFSRNVPPLAKILHFPCLWHQDVVGVRIGILVIFWGTSPQIPYPRFGYWTTAILLCTGRVFPNCSSCIF